MRRIAILTARALIAAALVAAVADVHLPGSSTARRRIHLIDRSGSVLVRGPSDSLTTADAQQLAEYDRTLSEPGDTVTWASFAADLAFESETVDPGVTDLQGALEKALARDPTEIILHTDGRADPGRALLLCRERGIPVHVFPLGPREVRDVRISRVRAPADAAPGEAVTLELWIEATLEGTVRLRMDDTVRNVDVAPGAPTRVALSRRGPGPFRVTIEPEDACPQNNSAVGRIDPRSAEPRILTLAPGTPFEDPRPYAAVVVDNVTPTPAQQKVLADYVQGLGGGLILLGGKESYARGNWKGTVLEALSPLRANPDDRIAVVFAVDASGSMGQPPEKIRDVLAAVRSAWLLLEEGEGTALILPGEGSPPRPYFIENPDRLRDVRPSGATVVAAAMDEARRHLVAQESGRRHLLLLTDGETAEKETPEMRRAAAQRLAQARIGLTVVTTNRKIEAGEHVSIDDWSALEAALGRILAGLRDVEKQNPGVLKFDDHECSQGVPRVAVPWMNRTTAKPNVEVVGTVGQDPAVAFHSVGRGRVGAMTLRRQDLPEGLLEQSIRYVSGGAQGGLKLSIDYPVVRARGSGPPQIDASYQDPSGASGAITLDQVASDVWEGTLPPTGPGTVSVRILQGGATASATIPAAAEYLHLGVDAAMLHRIADETGGRVLGSTQALEALPRPGRSEDVGGRPFFLLTALLLVFLELALTTFWKEKGAAYQR